MLIIMDRCKRLIISRLRMFLVILTMACVSGCFGCWFSTTVHVAGPMGPPNPSTHEKPGQLHPSSLKAYNNGITSSPFMSDLPSTLSGDSAGIIIICPSVKHGDNNPDLGGWFLYFNSWFIHQLMFGSSKGSDRLLFFNWLIIYVVEARRGMGYASLIFWLKCSDDFCMA